MAFRQSSFCSNFRAESFSFSRFMRLGLRRGTGDKAWSERKIPGCHTPGKQVAPRRHAGARIELSPRATARASRSRSGRGRPVGVRGAATAGVSPRSRRYRSPTPRPGLRGLRNSSPCAAQSSSAATTRCALAEDPLRLPGRGHAHGHEVLLIGVGRDRADARRHRDGPRLRHQRGRGDLHHHEAAAEPRIAGEERRQPLGEVGIHQPLHPPLGDRLQGGQGHGEQIQRLRHRLAVEVAARDHVAVIEHQRVVGGRVELDGNRVLGETDRVGHGARAPAERSAGCRRPGPEGRPPGGTPGSRCRRAAPRMRPPRPRSGRGAGRAAWIRGSSGAGVPRSASRLIAAAPTAVRQSTLRVVHQQRQQGRLRLGAVDEREPFLRREAERREPRGRRARPAPAARRPRRAPRPHP